MMHYNKLLPNDNLQMRQKQNKHEVPIFILELCNINNEVMRI